MRHQNTREIQEFKQRRNAAHVIIDAQMMKHALSANEIISIICNTKTEEQSIQKVKTCREKLTLYILQSTASYNDKYHVSDAPMVPMVGSTTLLIVIFVTKSRNQLRTLECWDPLMNQKARHFWSNLPYFEDDTDAETMINIVAISPVERY